MGNPQRAIDAVEAWAEDHLILISASFESFAKTEEWALIEELQHRFEVEGRFLDVGRLVWQMPSPLGYVEQGRLVLFCRALLHVPAASTLLEDWFRTIKHAYECWLGDRRFELISHEVVELLDGDAHRAKLVSRLLLQEPWMFGSGSGTPDGYWTRDLRSDVRAARNANDARELLDAHMRDDETAIQSASPATEPAEDPLLPPGPAPEQSDPEDTAAQPGRLRRLWNYASNNPLLATFLGTLSVVAILALGGLVFTGGKKLLEAVEQDSAPVAHGKFERAAEGGARTFPVPGVLGREGPPVKPEQKVQVLCRAYAPTPASVVPDGYWYKLSSSPWDGHYFAAANSFWNGDVPGHLPYTHYTDTSIKKCN